MPISFLALAIIQIGLIILGRLLAPRAQRRKSDPFDTPKSEEGAVIPKIFGIQQVTGNVTFVRDRSKDEGDENGPVFYFAKMHMVLAWGPLDYLYDIVSDERSLGLAVPGSAQSLTDSPELLTINPPLGAGLARYPLDLPFGLVIAVRQLFGGQTEQGGLQGEVRIYPGTSGQSIDPLVTEEMDTIASAYPHLIHACFGTQAGFASGSALDDRFYWVANTATPKPISFTIGCYPKALLGGTGRIGLDANPIEMIYETLTNPVWGLKRSTALFNLPNWTAAAQTCVNEALGLSATLGDSRSAEDFIDDVCSHIRGVVVTNPETGLLEIKLARGGYNFSSLVVLTKKNTVNFRQVTAQLPRTVNDIQVKFRRYDPGTGGVFTNVSVTLDAWISPYTYLIGLGGSYETRYTQVRWESGYRNLVAGTISAYRVRGAGNPSVALVEGVNYTVNQADGSFVFFRPSEANTNLIYHDEIYVNFTSTPTFAGFTDATATAQNLANRQIVGRTQADSYDYPMFVVPFLAQEMANHLRRMLSTTLDSYQWTATTREAAYLTEGDVVVVNEPAYRLDNRVIRITKVAYGDPDKLELTFEGVEDIFAEVEDFGFGNGTLLRAPDPNTAPPMAAFGCGQGGAGVIRVVLQASDPTYQIELQRATDVTGAGGATIVGAEALPGSTTFYDDTQAVAFAYRARQVRSGSLPGPWTAWLLCEPGSGSPVPPTCIVPTMDDQIDYLAGTVTTVLTDPDNRVSEVAFKSRSGTAPETVYAVDTDPYTATVVLVEGADSTITRRVRYYDCDGLLVTVERIITFPADGGPSYVTAVEEPSLPGARTAAPDPGAPGLLLTDAGAGAELLFGLDPAIRAGLGDGPVCVPIDFIAAGQEREFDPWPSATKETAVDVQPRQHQTYDFAGVVEVRVNLQAIDYDPAPGAVVGFQFYNGLGWDWLGTLTLDAVVTTGPELALAGLPLETGVHSPWFAINPAAKGDYEVQCVGWGGDGFAPVALGKNAVEVRYGSNSVTLPPDEPPTGDIEPDPPEEFTTDLGIWHKSYDGVSVSGTDITLVTDHTTPASDLVPIGTGAAPQLVANALNGVPAIAFSGGKGLVWPAAVRSLWPAGHLFVLLRKTGLAAPGVGEAGLWDVGGGSHSPDTYPDFFSQIQLSYGSNAYHYNTGVGTPVGVTSWHILEILAGGTWRCYRATTWGNKVLVEEDLVNTVEFANTPSIGGTYAVRGSYWSLIEWIEYSAIKDDTVRQGVYEHLMEVMAGNTDHVLGTPPGGGSGSDGGGDPTPGGDPDPNPFPDGNIPTPSGAKYYCTHTSRDYASLAGLNALPPLNTMILAGWTPDNAVSRLAAFAAAGKRVLPSLSNVRGNWTNSNGTFNYEMWKTWTARFRGSVWTAMLPYVANGTIPIFHMIDEPFCSQCFGGQGIPPAVVDDMARLMKGWYPGAEVLIRVSAMQMRGYQWRYVDGCYCQYNARAGGVDFTAGNSTNIDTYIAQNIAAAKSMSLRLTWGLNVINGGNGTSGITGDNRGGVQLWAMSPTEVRTYGLKMVTACRAGTGEGIGHWLLPDTSEYGYTPVYYTQPGMVQAFVDVATALAAP